MEIEVGTGVRVPDPASSADPFQHSAPQPRGTPLRPPVSAGRRFTFLADENLRGTPIADLSDEHYTVFYDAAWELARIGALRPGRVAPRNMETANDFGDHWSITNFGFEWLEKASSRPFLDMSRMSQVLAGFVPKLARGSDNARSRPSEHTGQQITLRRVQWPGPRRN